MIKGKSPFRQNNWVAMFLKGFAILILILASLIGISYGAEAGGVSTFAICFLVGIALFSVFYAVGEGLAILHDIRNKLYDRETNK